MQGEGRISCPSVREARSFRGNVLCENPAVALGGLDGGGAGCYCGSPMLKPCHECKTPVSTQARRCPQCGAEWPTRTAGQANQARGMRTLFLIVLGVCAVAWLLLSISQ